MTRGQAGLVVVGVTEMEVDIKQSMNHAERLRPASCRQTPRRSNKTLRPLEASRPPKAPPPKTDGFVQVHTMVMIASISMGDGAIVMASRKVALCRTT